MNMRFTKNPVLFAFKENWLRYNSITADQQQDIPTRKQRNPVVPQSKV
jgi:hypothetical protein